LGRRTKQLLAAVMTRLELASVAARFHVFALILCGAYALALLASRLLAIIPNCFGPLDLVALAAGALVLALAFHRRPSIKDASRRVDVRMRTDDLFLTTALIERSHSPAEAAQVQPAEFKPLVLAQAEEKAAKIAPRAVVPFAWAMKAACVTAAACVLLAGIFLLPQLDPFGKEKERQRIAQEYRKLQDSRKATSLRLAQLQKKETDAELSKQVAQAINDLKQTFQTMKPEDRKANIEQFKTVQAELAEMWRNASEQKLQDNFGKGFEPQKFGSADMQKIEQWRQDIQQGRADSLNKEISQLKADLDTLSKMSEGKEKKELQESIARRMKELSDFAAKEMGSKNADAALERALEQLAMADNPAMMEDALRAAQQSLELTNEEMKSLAQAARDLQALEDGLKALQMAKRLNEAGGCDGKECQGCQGMTDYCDLFEKLMKERRIVGVGTGGEGIGRGGNPPEDPTLETGYKPEKSRTSLTAGKLLLNMKTRGVSDTGDARQVYEDQLKAVKQGVSEAILHEQVPPAYHETIRKYFDSLTPAGAPSTAPDEQRRPASIDAQPPEAANEPPKE